MTALWAARWTSARFESRGFAISIVSGNDQQTTISTPFANPLVVGVTSAFGEPVGGGQVTFAAPTSGPSANLSSTTPVTIDASSQAQVSATANASGGTYSVVASASGAASASFTLTNQKLAQTIAFDPISNHTYGDPDIALHATATSGLQVTFTILSGPASVSGSDLTMTGAGTVIVQANQSGNDSYLAANPVAHSFVVNPASLTVTADAKNMTYGGTVPGLTYTYTGLVNGDTSASFTGALATTASSSSVVGGYGISEGTLAATGNYTIGTFIRNTLTVNPATPVLSWATPTPTVTARR